MSLPDVVRDGVVYAPRIDLHRDLGLVEPVKRQEDSRKNLKRKVRWEKARQLQQQKKLKKKKTPAEAAPEVEAQKDEQTIIDRPDVDPEEKVTESATNAETDLQGDNERQLKRRDKKGEFLAKCASGPTVVIDCEFDSVLTKKEISSLTQQIMFCYGVNKKAEAPVAMHLTGLSGQALANLNKISGFSSWMLNAGDTPYCELFPKDRLVYLSAEATEVVEEFDPNSVYIIGGIVDRNRLKGATNTKAALQGIRTARLPLDKYFDMGTATRVLTVNCVFEIILAHNHLKDWTKALEQCLPKRKNAVSYEARSDGEEDRATSSENDE